MSVKIIIAFTSGSLLTGCVAPLLVGAATLAGEGGAMLGSSALQRGMMNQTMRKSSSAQAIGSDIDPTAIRISHLTRNDTTETWIADSPEGRYSCSFQRGHTTVTCVHE
jgi:hypothetical protein